RGNVLDRRAIHLLEVPEDPAAEVGDVVGALLRRALQRPESRLQPAEDATDGTLGTDQRFQLRLDVAGREDAVEHHPVRAEDAGKRGVELLFDAPGRVLELAARLLERRQDPSPFAGDL